MRNITEESAKSSFSHTVYYEIGSIEKVLRVRVLDLMDLFENYSHYAIRFEYFNAEAEQHFIINVPGEEIEDFDLALDRILAFFDSKSENYAEVVFNSTEGFETGCYWDTVKLKWVGYARLGQNPESIIRFSKKDYLKFVSLIKKAKERITQ
ncbi:MAG: hypothetical protein A2W91_03140 [Bacteroidetes bacterium GWF2_38_335]|nr:MAG: hypothetical protein A2W91_03140 [Bacteroidetes bacterium GWF2_38_335]OFY77515.1 MAG: hypothetical protein A2281_01620 [Bacteroidetes bacterium RIFOXYA12_FULL_38_20]HBS87189.1 hypothetical protein [Bacteroidales bacterium]